MKKRLRNWQSRKGLLQCCKQQQFKQRKVFFGSILVLIPADAQGQPGIGAVHHDPLPFGKGGFFGGGYQNDVLELAFFLGQRHAHQPFLAVLAGIQQIGLEADHLAFVILGFLEQVGVGGLDGVLA